MNNEEYWANRAAWNMYHYMDEAEKAAERIAKVYHGASMWLSLETEGIFEKYMTKHKLSEDEARQLLNSLYDKTSLEELLRKLKKGSGEKTKAELLKELEAPAYQYRIDRLRQIQEQLDGVMINVYQQEKGFSTAFYTDLSNEVYYRSVFEIQKRAGVAFSFNHVSSKQIDKVLNMNWSGQHYSKRIWSNTQALAKGIKEELLVSLITGRTERETAEIISNKFGQGAMQARRLVRTESSFVSAELSGAARRECGIEKYQFIATLDLKTSKICREMDGRIFYERDRKAGVNCNPMHPWCRSTTLSVLDGIDLEKMTRTFRDPVTGKKMKIPRTMNYMEWYKQFVEGRPEAKDLD